MVRAETQAGEQADVGAVEGAACWLYLLVWFHGPPTMAGAPTIDNLLRIFSTGLPTVPCYRSDFFIEVPSCQMTLTCIKLT